MQLKINPILFGALLLGILIIVFALIKGCHNSDNLQTQLSANQANLDSLIFRHEADSMASKESEKHYHDSLEYTNGILDLSENKRQAIEEKLLTTTFAYTNLQKKYASIQPDTNTSVTLVPNEFVNDAHNCFESLEFHKKLVSLYVEEVKNVDSAHRSKEKLQENRIGQLTTERNIFQQNANDAIEIAGKAQDALKPRRKVLLSMGVIWSPLPRAVGAGLIYQDKRGRQFGLKGYASSWGTLGETQVNLPLSFKKR